MHPTGTWRTSKVLDDLKRRELGSQETGRRGCRKLRGQVTAQLGVGTDKGLTYGDLILIFSLLLANSGVNSRLKSLGLCRHRQHLLKHAPYSRGHYIVCSRRQSRTEEHQSASTPPTAAPAASACGAQVPAASSSASSSGTVNRRPSKI